MSIRTIPKRRTQATLTIGRRDIRIVGDSDDSVTRQAENLVRGAEREAQLLGERRPRGFMRDRRSMTIHEREA